ncbi:MAG: rhomboid family intramembrane serine protease [Actinobacteria bacterium]|nr:rhomboid family intramembrane serine protease [Actinomycetota bacterium]MSZ12648.1 rhomboid family intramembrane serine protease [Actinomycetota bacterium]MSZ28585.1 rhomboid family intramembrane serine protease [Actinomycetota bacterium]
MQSPQQRLGHKINQLKTSQLIVFPSLKRSATYSLIAIICGAYLVQLLVPSIQQQLFLPSIDYLSATNQWYRLFTVALTHGGLLHLGFNMYALLVLGNPIEEAFGKNKFLIIFFASLLSGSLTSSYFASIYSASVGASGAVFGLFGAMIVVGKRIGADIRSIVVIIGLNFVFGFALGGVDWRAHLGGLIGGYITSQIVLNKR